jgi:hypothetical protein
MGRLLRLEALEERTLLTGTWTNVANLLPDVQTDSEESFTQMSLLLPNGDVLAKDGGTQGLWFLLKPDATGGYQNGTWTQTGTMNVGRTYFGSDVLPNGNVFVVGGEYAADGGYDDSLTEIYNLATGVWTFAPIDPSVAGDIETETLPDGSVLVGELNGYGTEIYNPATNTWSAGGSKIRYDNSQEESWVKLPNGEILDYDEYTSEADNRFEAEIYNPATNSWSDASNATSTLPLLTVGDEMGGCVMLPNGNALFTGPDGYTAYYNTATNLWSAGPTMPVVSIDGVETQLAQGDAPSAVLPDGDVLMSLGPVSGGLGGPPTYIYDLNPTTGVYTNVTPPSSVAPLSSKGTYSTSMMVLPTGQILLNDNTDDPAIYTPDGSPNPSWQPQINSFVNNGDGSYTLTGTQLNGLDEGAYYGDDEQMASDYPIVQVTDTVTGNVYYATTSNWSSTDIVTGATPETVNVVLPAALGTDPFSMVVIANGISSVPIDCPLTAPVVTPSGTTNTFTVGGAAVALDAGVTMVASDANLGGASVQISNDQAGDSLNFTNQNGISGSYSGGVLTLTGSATVAQYQTALQSVTFSTTSTNTTPRSLSIVVNDGSPDDLDSNSAAEQVNVSTTVPTLTASGTTATFHGAAVAVDSGLTASPSGSDLTGATVTINNVQSGDMLNFTNQSGISGSYTGGLLTLSGFATVAQYQAALRSVTFSTTSLNTTPRSLAIVALDGPLDSNTVPESVDVTIAPPVVTPSGATSTFVTDGPAVAVDAGVTVTSYDTDLTGATVTISAGTLQAGDTLNFTNQNGISGSYSVVAGAGVLTLTGSATPAQYQAALQSVTFSTTDASAVVRSISTVVDDGSASPTTSNTAAETVNVTLGPFVMASGTTNTFTAGEPAVAVDSGVTVSFYQANLTGATITINNVQSGDTLNFTNQSGITGNYAAGVLTLTGSATPAQYQAALQSVTFSTDENITTRSLSIAVAAGAMESNSAAEAVNVVVPDPVVTASGAINTFTVSGPAVAVDAGVTVTSGDADLTGATVTIGDGRATADTLHFTNQNGITGSYNSSTGILTLSGSDPPELYQTALQSVTFSTTSSSNAARTITIEVDDSNDSDGDPDSTTEVVIISRAPVVTPSGTTNTFTVTGSPVVLDSGVTVTVTSSESYLSSASVTITNYQPGDSLNYITVDNITGSYSAGVLTLTGTRLASNYQTALRSVTFSTTSTDTAARSLSIVAVGYYGNSIPAAESVNVAINAPVLKASGSTGQTFALGGSAVAVDSGITTTSADADLTGATETVANYQSGDSLNFTNQNGITGVYSGGILTLTGGATPAQYQAALESVTFSTTSTVHGTRTIDVVASDSNANTTTSNTAVDSVVVAIAPPSVAASGSTGQTFTLGGSNVTVDSGVTVSSTDADLTSATETLTNAQTGDTLHFSTQNGITGNYSSGVLTLTGTATVANYQTALESVTFSTTSTVKGTRTVDVVADDSAATPSTSSTAIDSVVVAIAAPVVTASGSTGQTYTLGGSNVAVDSGITATSADASLTGATETITNAQTGDTLHFSTQNGITGSYSSGVLTLTGTATPAFYQTALESVTFSTTSTTKGTRTIDVVASDSNANTTTSNTAVDSVVVAINAPVVTAHQTSINSTAGQTVTVDSAVTVTSADADLTGATVTIGTGYQAGNDTLHFTNQNGITIASNTGGVLTLSGSATPANYQTALASVTYSSTSASTATRNISIVVTDSNATTTTSNTATTQILVSAPLTITGAYVAGSNWTTPTFATSTERFDSYLVSHSLGDATIPTVGYALKTGATQTTTLPFANINTISVSFSGTVSNIGLGSLKLLGGTGGGAVAAPSVTGFTSDGSNTYSWSLSGNLGNNKYIFAIATTGSSFGASSTQVTDANGAGISGKFTTSSSTFPSGNGLAGSTFDFSFNVLPGDGNQSANVNATDSAGAKALNNDHETTTGYNPYYDYNGAGIINSADPAVDSAAVNTKQSSITSPTAPADSQVGSVGSSSFTALALGVQEIGSSTSLTAGSSSSTSSTSTASNVVSSSTTTTTTTTTTGTTGTSGGSSGTTSTTTASRSHGRHEYAAVDAALSEFDLADAWT